MENFTPWSALAGGALLGLSAVLLMLFSGKVAGISGILGGICYPQKGQVSWRVAFVIGMLSAAFILMPFNFSLPNLPEISHLQLIAAGLLVGFGTRLGNGCTSGHGIIGMGRFSKRSIIATLVFMGCAIVVVLIRQLLGAL